LLESVMEGGRRTRPAPALAEIRGYAAAQRAALPAAMRDPRASACYPVEISERLRNLARRIDNETR